METFYSLNGGKIVVDSAFNLSDKDYIVQSAHQDPIGNNFVVH